MVDAALQAGLADRLSVFEVFTRPLPFKRRYGIFAGLGRLVSAIESFRFTDDQLDYLSRNQVVSAETLAFLRDFKFSGEIRAYREGELFFPHSPVLTVKAPSGCKRRRDPGGVIFCLLPIGLISRSWWMIRSWLTQPESQFAHSSPSQGSFLPR